MPGAKISDKSTGGRARSQYQAGVLMRDEQVEPVAGLEEVGQPGEDRDPPDKLDILRAMGDMRWEGWVIGRGSMRAVGLRTDCRARAITARHGCGVVSSRDDGVAYRAAPGAVRVCVWGRGQRGLGAHHQCGR